MFITAHCSTLAAFLSGFICSVFYEINMVRCKGLLKKLAGAPSMQRDFRKPGLVSFLGHRKITWRLKK